ncbi:MAG: Flp pilus assembly protein CpaB, partial [Gammaproteobacteria bacterium]
MAEARESRSAFGIPLIVGAIGFGLAAAVMAFIYLKAEKAALLEKYAGANRKEIAVLVAAKDLPKGTTLREEYLSQRRIPAGFVSNDAIAAADYEKYLGRVLETDVGAGKPLLTSYLDTHFPRDFSDLVTVGRRAMTIQVDDLNSIAGFIRPGNRIDLFVTIPSALSGFSAGFITANMIDAIPPDLRNAIPASLLEAARGADTSDGTIRDLLANAMPKDLILPVLQNVHVLATGRDPYREELDQLAYPQPRTQRNFNTVTLDLAPREAALLSAAIKKGDMLALLRNRKDEGGADFSTLSAQDLFGNAFDMAKAEAQRRQRVAVAAGVDRAGNLVDADGNTVMTQAQLVAAGLTVNDKGEIVDRNGKVIEPDDIVVTADGRIVQKSALAAAGLSVNAAGQIVDGTGRIVDADEVVVTADGKVVTKSQLAAAGLHVNEAGEVVDASGKVVDTRKLIVAPDGRVLSHEQLAKAGLAVNDKGEIVDASGKVVDPTKLIVSANGEVLDQAKLEAAGLRVDAEGRVVDASGKPVDPATLVTDANGRIV